MPDTHYSDPIQVRDHTGSDLHVQVCYRCGALIAEPDWHDNWHDQHADDGDGDGR